MDQLLYYVFFFAHSPIVLRSFYLITNVDGVFWAMMTPAPIVRTAWAIHPLGSSTTRLFIVIS
jgi:hypothetical protein